MFTSGFATATAERAIRTFAQSLLAILSGNGLGWLDVDWGNALQVSLLATLGSVLTSIVASQFGNRGPSLANETLTAGRDHTDVTDARLR